MCFVFALNFLYLPQIIGRIIDGQRFAEGSFCVYISKSQINTNISWILNLMGGTVPRDLLREADGEDAGTTSVLLSASHPTALAHPCLSLPISVN